MNLTKENLREKKFHDELQSKSVGRFENIFYKALGNTWEDFYNSIRENSKNSIVLDYGCGIGPSLKKIITFKPKKIVGIDISEVSINKAKQETKNYDGEIELLVDNCENTRFRENQFDIVYGLGILHHLDFSKCIDEILRILKPGGLLFFVEPLGTNPLINIYRKFTPKSRSKDEHPLVRDDLELIDKKFENVEKKFYGFFTLIFFPFYKDPKKSFLFKIFKNIDQFFFRIKIFRPLAWSVLISARKKS